jgi:hypothetical protein
MMKSSRCKLLLILLSIGVIACSSTPSDSVSLIESDFSIPILDLSRVTRLQRIVDRESGQYLGHPTTVLLDDGRSLLTTYPKGHGRGPIVYKRSDDGGATWSKRLPTPTSWESSLEVPTLFRFQKADGNKRIILFSGLYPIRMALSDDDGDSWTELEPIGDFGGIVAMSSLIQQSDGSLVAFFHDDGRFIADEGERTQFTVYRTVSDDDGLTWGEPELVVTSASLDLCEPGAVWSPDGQELALLLRENSRESLSHVVYSGDESETWSSPTILPPELTGDRHTARYLLDGRLFIAFRDMAPESPTSGDWVAWIGTYENIRAAEPGQYRIRIMDNKNAWDSTYPGVEILPDGSIVTTTYGHWAENEEPYIVSVRVHPDELDDWINQLNH